MRAIKTRKRGGLLILALFFLVFMALWSVGVFFLTRKELTKAGHDIDATRARVASLSCLQIIRWVLNNRNLDAVTGQEVQFDLGNGYSVFLKARRIDFRQTGGFFGRDKTGARVYPPLEGYWLLNLDVSGLYFRSRTVGEPEAADGVRKSQFEVILRNYKEGRPEEQDATKRGTVFSIIEPD